MRKSFKTGCFNATPDGFDVWDEVSLGQEIEQADPNVVEEFSNPDSLTIDSADIWDTNNIDGVNVDPEMNIW